MVEHEEVFDMEQRFLCKQCRHIFDLEISNGSSLDGEVQCPACGSSDVMEAWQMERIHPIYFFADEVQTRV